MKRLKYFILVFFFALSIPLGYFIFQTYLGLEQQEKEELRYFSETLFDEMERGFITLVIQEEGRAVDEYNYRYIPSGQLPQPGKPVLSPLSSTPKEPYILGYFQNNPDGSFESPIIENMGKVPQNKAVLFNTLKEINTIFNQKRMHVSDDLENLLTKKRVEDKQVKTTRFEEKYLARTPIEKEKIVLGKKKKSVQAITVEQAQNIAKQDKDLFSKVQKLEPEKNEVEGTPAKPAKGAVDPSLIEETLSATKVWETSPTESVPLPDSIENRVLQAEVDPLQSVLIDDRHVVLFRRIMINNQVYRQGLVLIIDEFFQHLLDTYFTHQPMAVFTNLHLKVLDKKQEVQSIQAGAPVEKVTFFLDRVFPRPFAFLQASMTCDTIPQSSSRKTLGVMMFLLSAVVLLGFLAIYQSARSIIDLSERRSGFVSSVTHELKTPLTNIRMYVEMLEQGIARNREREQEYFGIVLSESGRLSRLINNVLEFSKFDKKQRHLNMEAGHFKEITQEAQNIMKEKLRQEGFTFKVNIENIRPFQYDRELMIQILINLIENSMKFGKGSSEKEITLRAWSEDNLVKISLSDTGPGIPKKALKKIFHDFYRVDNSLTRTTAGTGIGLALVKKFVTAMNGTIHAANNEGAGCTIIINLPG